MADFSSTIAQHGDLSEKAQAKAGSPMKTDLDQQHRDFLKNVIALIDSDAIDPYQPRSLLNQEVYDNLDEEWHDKVDLSLINIASQLQKIEAHYRAEQHPNESMEMKNMIEHLWQMKQQIEEYHDAFKI